MIKLPDRDRELAVIASTRAMLDDDLSMDTLASWFKAAVPDFMKFRMQGAAWDALSSLPDVQRGQRKLGGLMNKELHALLWAATVRCLVNRCQHVLRDPGVVKYAILGARVLTCNQCVLTFAEDLAQHDDSGAGRDECDLCLKRGVTIFCDFQLAWNGCVFMGSYCDACNILCKRPNGGATS